MSTSSPLRILQIGHGRFGREHQLVWQKLVEQGLVSVTGIVVNSAASRDALAATTSIPVYCGLDGVSLDGIEAVDIVTPAETHFDLVRRLLPLTNVLVEKPLATTPEHADILAQLAETSTNLLSVGHVYRFHPLIKVLRNLVADIDERPQVIFGTMLNPIGEAPPNAEPSLELLHYFDVVDMLFGEEPSLCSAVQQDKVSHVSLCYPGRPGERATNAVFRLGWEGERRQRSLELVYRDRTLQADLIDQMVTVDLGTSMRRIILPHAHAALEAELRGFVAAVRQRSQADVSGATAARIVRIASRARPSVLKHAPRVAVIGGGIFGATCAAELGEFCDVTLIERHPDLLAEASNLNQWRYHHGFHYPRSVEMINEIKECRHAFEEVYGDAVVGGISSYYATASTARIITGERYLHTCTAMGLAFEVAPPPNDVLDLAQVSLCLRTGEGVFDANIMRAIMRRRLSERAGITLALGHDVVDGALLGDGRKRLVLKHGDNTREGSFDYVVNATYANRNLLTKLFGFPMEPLRFDLLELLLLEVSLPRMSVTILDGPFTSLVSMGADNQFTLSHIQHSLLASETPADGFPPVWAERPSNRENLLREATRYLPILHNARYLGSRYGTRVVNARPQDVDGRPTVVVDHGFGCWSILGGKVNTSVSNARQIASQIASQQRIDRPDKGAIERRVVDEGQLWRDRSPVGARRS